MLRNEVVETQVITKDEVVEDVFETILKLLMTTIKSFWSDY